MVHVGVCLYPRKAQKWMLPQTGPALLLTWKLCVAIPVFPFANSDRFEGLSVSIRCEISSHASHML